MTDCTKLRLPVATNGRNSEGQKGMPKGDSA
jgi:hypothetical protein